MIGMRSVPFFAQLKDKSCIEVKDDQVANYKELFWDPAKELTL